MSESRPDLHALLDDAVSDVHPSGGPEHIRARAAQPAPARWLPVTLAAAVATVLVIGGTAWLGNRDSGTPPAADGVAPTPARTVQVPVYYALDSLAGDQRPALVMERHRVSGTTESNLQVALDEAMTGRPLDPDYRRAWPLGKGVTARATATDTEITIDLRLADGDFGMTTYEGGDERAFQALVWTADAATESDLPVRFLVEGEQEKDFLGFDISEPIQRASADSVLAPVSISSPSEGETVSAEFEVRGEASAPEANVVWELKDGDTVVRTGFTTAKECCTLSPYAFTVDAPPGDYTLVVHDTDDSDGEGNGIVQDTKRITVE